MRGTEIANGMKLVILSVVVLFGCAKERPVKNILANGKRVPVASFEGTFLYLRAVSGVKTPGTKIQRLHSGMYLNDTVNSGLLVKFINKEKTLDVVSIDPLYTDESSALQSNLLASFKVRHVDVLKRQNSEGQDTNEEEETEARRPWNERTYIVLDPTDDSQDPFKSLVKASSTPDNLDVTDKAINISVTHILSDDTEVTQRQSFLRFQPNASYTQMDYPFELQKRFGFFKTTSYKLDAFNRITKSQRKEFANRWDTSKKIVYHLSKDYPEYLKAATRQVFASWNDVFKKATGKDVLEVHDNNGQELGDLRYNLVFYDNSIEADHGILGYGPSYVNPRTGEIVKADVILYGGVFKKSMFSERLWEKLLGKKQAEEKVAENLNPNSVKTLEQKTDKVTAFAQMKSVNAEMQALSQEEKNEMKGADTLRAAMLKDLKSNTTRLSEQALFHLGDVNVSKMSNEELEAAVLLPILTHELGHNFGLRHNFMGSVDDKHYGGGNTSSVMDYGFLLMHEPAKPAPYDAAAIQIAYGSDKAKTESLRADNYFFCTDEDTFSSENAYCNQFDEGANLVDISMNQFQRYQGSYVFNNLRLDRVFFGYDFRAYINKVRGYLRPFRKTYDYSTSVIKSVKNPVNLWRLLKQKIEADKNSDPAKVMTIEVDSTIQVDTEGDTIKIVPIKVKKQIDTNKIAAALKEAKDAKALSFAALRQIVLEGDRGDYDSGDLIEGEFQIRGVLYDKIIALSLLGLRTPDPLGGGSSISVFSTLEGGQLKQLFQDMLSDTARFVDSKGNDAGYDFSPVDINLKEIALDLLINEIAVPGLSASSRELIAIEKVTAPQVMQELLASKEARKKVVTALKEMINASNPSEEQAALLQAKLMSAKAEVAKASHVYTSLIGDQLLKAPMAISQFSMETASGHLLRDNLNLIEDQISAVTQIAEESQGIIEAEMKKPEKERNLTLIIQSGLKKDSMVRAAENLNQLLASEKMFAITLYRAYEGIAR